MKTRLSRAILCVCSVIMCSYVLTACGGSDSSYGDYIEGASAYATISTDPEQIDTADLTVVEVSFGDLQVPEIDLKLRYPRELSFIANTGILEIGDYASDIAPGAHGSDSEHSYLVFYIKRSDLLTENEAVLRVKLKGNAAVLAGAVAVDVDVHTTNNFSAADPQFTAQDEAFIQVGPVLSEAVSSSSSSLVSSSKSSASSSSSSSSSVSSKSSSSSSSLSSSQSSQASSS